MLTWPVHLILTPSLRVINSVCSAAHNTRARHSYNTADCIRPILPRRLIFASPLREKPPWNSNGIRGCTAGEPLCPKCTNLTGLSLDYALITLSILFLTWSYPYKKKLKGFKKQLKWCVLISFHDNVLKNSDTIRWIKTDLIFMDTGPQKFLWYDPWYSKVSELGISK